MGVRGLTTYIAVNSDRYLKPYELCDCYLVVDGNSIASHLYKWVVKSDSAFGGDYDEYYKIVRKFFETLKRCRVVPIVLFDGGYEKKKILTVLSRASSKYPQLRALNQGFTADKFFPLFMKQTFFDVMDDLEIFCVQCDLEADKEIASTAKVLNCPVLSYDSDFYIYGVLYIPFSSIQLDSVRVEDPDKGTRNYMKCLIYDIDYFLKEFDGLDRSLLPIAATLLGNDCIDNSIFWKFFLHVAIPKSKHKSFTQRKIHGLFNWLKSETVESATKLILTHLENKHASKVVQIINMSVEDYTKASLSSGVCSGLKKLTKPKQNFPLDFNEKMFQVQLPTVLIELFQKCRLHKHVMDILTLGVYFTQLQVENLHHQSSHYPALNLISAFFSLLEPYIITECKYFKVYLTVKNHYNYVTLKKNPKFIITEKLEEILNQTKQARLEILYKIMEMNDEETNTVSLFPDDWCVFVLAFLDWIKKLNNSITLAHIYSLLLMAVSNRIVQKNVGYYRLHSKFMKKKGALLSKLSDTTTQFEDKNNVDEDNFKDLSEAVTQYECLLTQKNLIPFRQTTEKGRGRAYSLYDVHLFGCFQSCLYHIMQLNALLDYPLQHLKISDFYSGTLLINFYIYTIEKVDVRKFGCDLLKDTPNLFKIYDYVCRVLCKYSVKEYVPVNKGKKKKKKGKSGCKNDSVEKLVIKSNDSSEDLEDYVDENNIYAYLQINKSERI